MGRLLWTPEVALAADVNLVQMALAARFDEQDDLHRAIYAAAGAKLKPKRRGPQRKPNGAEIAAWFDAHDAVMREKNGQRN